MIALECGHPHHLVTDRTVAGQTYVCWPCNEFRRAAKVPPHPSLLALPAWMLDALY